MLEPQSTELQYKTECFIDNAVENASIDMGSRMVLIIYGDRPKIESIVAGQHIIPADDGVIYMDAQYNTWKGKRAQKSEMLMDYASELLAQLEPIHRAGAMLLGTAGLRNEVNGISEIFSAWAIADSCEGGCIKPYNKTKYAWRQREKLDHAPFKRTNRRIHSPKWIKRYIAAADESNQMRTLWHALKARNEARPACLDANGAWHVFDADYAKQRERFKAKERAAFAQIMAGGTRPGMPKLEQQKIWRQKRKVAARSALFAAGILGAGTVSAFAAGLPIDLEGHHSVLQISKRSTIHSAGHGSLDIALLSKEKTKLADLCFYIEKSPAIDQLAALALAMQCGEDREIIATANVVKISPSGIGHELLPGRQLPIGRNQIYNARELRNSTYWQETQQIWTGLIGEYVFHRDWKYVKNIGQTI